MHIVYAKLGQADAGDNEAKLMTKLAPEWVRTSDPVIRSPARYRWTTAPASISVENSNFISFSDYIAVCVASATYETEYYRQQWVVLQETLQQPGWER